MRRSRDEADIVDLFAGGEREDGARLRAGRVELNFAQSLFDREDGLVEKIERDGLSESHSVDSGFVRLGDRSEISGVP